MTAEAGSTIQIAITPDPGMRLKPGTLKYNDGTTDVPIDESNCQFTMPAADITVSAEFEPIPPTLYSVAIGTLTGGTITINFSSAEAGSTIKLAISPALNMRLKPGTLKYNDGINEVLIDEITCEFPMPASDITVSAEFEPILYSVTVSSLSGGSITADPLSAQAGDTIDLTITPDQNIRIKAGSLKYNDGTADTAISGTSFIMPGSSEVISAEFEAIPPGPDLKLEVSDVSSQYATGDKYSISVLVTNIGEIASPETKIVLYMGNMEVCSAKVKNLKPGKSANLKLKGKVPEDMVPGTYDIRAEIEPVANEKNVADNIWTSQFSIAGLDLSVDRVDPPAVIIAGLKTAVTVTVDNADNSSLNDVKVNLYYSADGVSKDSLLGTDTIKKLKKGTGKAKIEFKPSKDFNLSKKYMIAEVDPDNTIAEANEDNNLKAVGTFVGWDKLPWFWLGPWAN